MGAKLPDTLATELLFIDNAVCVSAANNPLLQKKLTLKKYLQAKHMVIIFPEELYRRYIDNTLDTLGYKRNAIVAIPHMVPGLFAIAKTPFIVTTTANIAHSMTKLLKLAMQKPPFATKNVEVKQAWPRQFTHDPAHQWLRGLIKEAALHFRR
jgi:DNA-binding transcriptional LysR family regulator